MRGWRRRDFFDATGLQWVMPSPNMPTLDTARVYPGGCLLEGTNLSEGRGTTRPFQLVGAPWLDPWKLADVLNDNGSAKDAVVEALADGDMISPKEIVLRIRARYRAFGLFETALLGIMAMSTGWATAQPAIATWHNCWTVLASARAHAKGTL